MKMRIKEFAVFAGVSVRTLHYYDEIGLLKPAQVDLQSGYRYYDEESLTRMQEILFYRELDFPLKTIRAILASPEYDWAQAIEAQKNLLLLKKNRLERIIAALDRQQRGEQTMNAFTDKEYEAARAQYEQEAKQKWGATEAYAEYAKRSKGRSAEQNDALAQGMDRAMAAFARCMQEGHSPESAEAQDCVRSLQDYISAHYYPCTNAILAGLGQMYTADERFRINIDKHAEGTADFLSRAIAFYCR